MLRFAVKTVAAVNGEEHKYTYALMQRQEISDGPLSGLVIIFNCQPLLHAGAQLVEVAALQQQRHFGTHEQEWRMQE